MDLFQTARGLSSADLEAVLSVTRHLAAPFELSAMLGEVTAAARHVLRAERSSVWLLDRAAEHLVLEVSSDIGQLRVPVSHGLVGACARERRTINVPDCYADPRFDTSVDRQSGFRTRCCLTLPLIDHRDVLVGVMQILNKIDGAFDAADVALGETLAAQCAVALARARLTEEALEAVKLRQELELARIVQTSSLPRALPDLPDYDLHATFLPAAQTGGDTYDLALVGDQLLVVLADAAGHGIAPALTVMQMQAMLRMAFRLGASLPSAFAQVNDQLADILPAGYFVNAFIGLLDPPSHRLQFLSGGQAPILHFGAASGEFAAYKATSFPMGAMPLVKPRIPVAIDLARGDILVLVSDGILEFENRSGERFWRERLEQVVRRHAHEPAAALSACLLASVHAFAQGAGQEDDITIVLVKRKGGA